MDTKVLRRQKSIFFHLLSAIPAEQARLTSIDQIAHDASMMGRTGQVVSGGRTSESEGSA